MSNQRRIVCFRNQQRSNLRIIRYDHSSFWIHDQTFPSDDIFRHRCASQDFVFSHNSTIFGVVLGNPSQSFSQSLLARCEPPWSSSTLETLLPSCSPPGAGSECLPAHFQRPLSIRNDRKKKPKLQSNGLVWSFNGGSCELLWSLRSNALWSEQIAKFFPSSSQFHTLVTATTTASHSRVCRRVTGFRIFQFPWPKWYRFPAFKMLLLKYSPQTNLWCICDNPRGQFLLPSNQNRGSHSRVFFRAVTAFSQSFRPLKLWLGRSKCKQRCC